MSLTDPAKYRLSEQDEAPHAIEPVKNFNESMYINVFDHSQQLGGWFRIGNRPNEGYAEMSCCVYLPAGKVAFMFARPSIVNNDAFSAGGLSIEVTEPFKQVLVKYSGPLCVLDEPAQMENPKLAFTDNPLINCEILLEFTGCAPPQGGEQINAQGEPIKLDPEKSFFRGHYEQHMSGRGQIRVGNQLIRIDGLGLRDHSWGPRYWQNMVWYRWIPMNFTKDFAVAASIIRHLDGSTQVWAMVLDGSDYQSTEKVKLQVQYDHSQYPKNYRLSIELAERTLVLEATVLSQIPLRNRRKTQDGQVLHTRIVEGLTRFECKGQTGFGMTEFLDQIIDDMPAGVIEENQQSASLDE